MNDKLTEWNDLAMRLIEDPTFTDQDYERFHELDKECREQGLLPERKR